MSLRKMDYGRDSEEPPSMVGENSHFDDATSTPHTSDTSVVQVPFELQKGEPRERGMKRGNLRP